MAHGEDASGKSIGQEGFDLRIYLGGTRKESYHREK
jgi:hypothetical protein